MLSLLHYLPHHTQKCWGNLLFCTSRPQGSLLSHGCQKAQACRLSSPIPAAVARFGYRSRPLPPFPACQKIKTCQLSCATGTGNLLLSIKNLLLYMEINSRPHTLLCWSHEVCLPTVHRVPALSTAPTVPLQDNPHSYQRMGMPAPPLRGGKQ
jgi:hypothetical protein